jgi:hypothetical protein
MAQKLAVGAFGRQRRGKNPMNAHPSFTPPRTPLTPAKTKRREIALAHAAQSRSAACTTAPATPPAPSAAYSEGIESCFRAIHGADPDKKADVFKMQARDGLKYARASGIDVVGVSDRFQQVAEAIGLVREHGQNTVQRWLADARTFECKTKLRSVDGAGEAENNTLDTLALRMDRKQVSAIDYGEFLARPLPPRETLLAPWLPAQGIAMIHAPRGLGKTHVGLGTAWAVASGGGFLRWRATGGARRVLLLDGEMPGVVLQERLACVVKASGLVPPMSDYLKVAAADLMRDGLPDLADPASQSFYCDVVADADLVVVDNLSTLCRGLKENDADSWAPVQAWCLSLRRRGKSVLLIHHDGKNGGQRGTSRKEDVLDTVIGLRKPPDYQADQGARFEIHFEKARGFYGPDAEPFEARLIGDQWQEGPIKSGDDLETLMALRDQGMSIRAISERTGVPRATVHRKVNANGGGD